MGPQYASGMYTKNRIRKRNQPGSFYTLSPKCKQRDCLGLEDDFFNRKKIVHYSSIDSLSLFFKNQI